MSVGAESQTVTFRDITTIGVGGVIHDFLEPCTPEELVEIVSHADHERIPVCVIGGGSNLLVSDEPFPGVVIRYAARAIHETRLSSLLSPQSPRSSSLSRSGERQQPSPLPPSSLSPKSPQVSDSPAQETMSEGECVRLQVDAGCNWDDFVARAVELGLNGVEGLSGIPGTVGASVVQNIGAYGQEAASSVDAVEAWDRLEHRLTILRRADLGFGYRTSALKLSMIRPDGSHDPRWYPTPRFVVLSVTFSLHRGAAGTIGYQQLAHTLGQSLGETVDTHSIRTTVLRVRAAKGMLEDAHRYENPAMRGMKDAAAVEMAVRSQTIEEQTGDAGGNRAYVSTKESKTGDMPVLRSDRHSCGSFFINPMMTLDQAASLPADAPRFPAMLGDGSAAVKTSAAWLIDHAGFHKGFRLDTHAPAGVSTRHTLALVNRGDARADDVAKLARRIQHGVFEHFGVRLMPEPVIYGLDL